MNEKSIIMTDLGSKYFFHSPNPVPRTNTICKFGLFNLMGKTVHDPFAVEISKDAWLLRLSPSIEPGLYIMHISIDGHGQTVRLLMR